MFIWANANASPMAVMACSECSKKRNEDIIKILRNFVTWQFGIKPTKPPDLVGAPLVENFTELTVNELRLAIVDGVEGKPCRQALYFMALLEKAALPRFVFAIRGHGNCFSITQQLYLDLKSLGIAEMFAFKEGNSSLLKVDGAPVGSHRWIELDGWVIDASGAAFGNPILFQNAETYYARRMMADIKEVERRGDLAEG